MPEQEIKNFIANLSAGMESTPGNAAIATCLKQAAVEEDGDIIRIHLRGENATNTAWLLDSLFEIALDGAKLKSRTYRRPHGNGFMESNNHARVEKPSGAPANSPDRFIEFQVKNSQYEMQESAQVQLFTNTLSALAEDMKAPAIQKQLSTAIAWIKKLPSEARRELFPVAAFVPADPIKLRIAGIHMLDEAGSEKFHEPYLELRVNMGSKSQVKNLRNKVKVMDQPLWDSALTPAIENGKRQGLYSGGCEDSATPQLRDNILHIPLCTKRSALFLEGLLQSQAAEQNR